MRFNPQIKLACKEQFISFLIGNKVFPINIEISPSGTCNAKCPWCFYRNQHQKVFIQTTPLKSFLTYLDRRNIKAITWTGGGEPTLHPQFNEFVELVDKLKIKQGLITNGLAKINYDSKMFEWIRVSVTPNPLNEDNLRKMGKCKTLGICINDTGDEETIKETLRVGEKIGVDYVQVRPALFSLGSKSFIQKPTIKHDLLEISLYKYEDQMKNRDYDKCYGFHFVPFLWEDGNLDVCGYMRGISGYNLGNIYRDNFDKIFENLPEYVPTIKTCQICCKNHEINKLINTAKKIEDGDFV